MYSVPKESGTYADTLLAYGAARFLQKLGGDEALVTLVDQGDRFELRCDVTPDTGRQERLLLYPFVSVKAGDAEGQIGDIIRYEEERRRQPESNPPSSGSGPARRRGRRRSTVPPGLTPEIADAIADREAVRPEIRLVALLRSLDKGGAVARGNDLRLAWAARGHVEAGAVLEALRNGGWSVHRARLAKAYGTETLGLALNPHAGKGTNQAKPAGPDRDNLKGPAAEEWLKYGGLYEHAYVHAVKRGANRTDIEILVPVPSDIPLADATRVMSQLREEYVRGNSVKFEVLATLAYARILALRHRAAAQDRIVSRRRLNRIVSGIQIAYFQDLGGGKAVTGVYTLGLPSFFDLHQAEDVDAYVRLVEEHQQCIRGLDEDRGDETALLVKYREYLSSGEIMIFLQFLSQFGELALRSRSERDRRAWLRTFGSAGVERIVRGGESMDLSQVVSDPGFRNIAHAIRRSTVGEMYWKSERNDQIYDIRYGLGQELRRRAPRPSEFLAALSKFVQSYNEENAKIRDSRGSQLAPHRRRRDVTDADLDAVVRLVSEAEDPEAVALLLVGYGYTREEREGAAGDETSHVSGGRR